MNLPGLGIASGAVKYVAGTTRASVKVAQHTAGAVVLGVISKATDTSLAYRVAKGFGDSLSKQGDSLDLVKIIAGSPKEPTFPVTKEIMELCAGAAEIRTAAAKKVEEASGAFGNLLRQVIGHPHS